MDNEEVRLFCAEEHPRLVGSMALYTGDLLIAEELAQEALTRAIQDWSRLQRVERRGAYVHRIAINLAHSHFRRRAAQSRAERRLAAGANEAIGGPDPEEVIVVRQAIATLPPRSRAVVVLRFHGGFSLAEVAEVLDVTVGTVKSQLHRGLARMREFIDAAEDVHVG